MNKRGEQTLFVLIETVLAAIAVTLLFFFSINALAEPTLRNQQRMAKDTALELDVLFGTLKNSNVEVNNPVKINPFELNAKNNLLEIYNPGRSQYSWRPSYPYTQNMNYEILDSNLRTAALSLLKDPSKISINKFELLQQGMIEVEDIPTNADITSQKILITSNANSNDIAERLKSILSQEKTSIASSESEASLIIGFDYDNTDVPEKNTINIYFSDLNPQISVKSKKLSEIIHNTILSNMPETISKVNILSPPNHGGQYSIFDNGVPAIFITINKIDVPSDTFQKISEQILVSLKQYYGS